ncbi:hypothetical protein HK096_005587 [Nowakowskiella sp. JEL0078]|nr:hypothetical protein HK096_005587 [Nowakowskiella sp. JEL0078]
MIDAEQMEISTILNELGELVTLDSSARNYICMKYYLVSAKANIQKLQSKISELESLLDILHSDQTSKDSKLLLINNDLRETNNALRSQLISNNEQIQSLLDHFKLNYDDSEYVPRREMKDLFYQLRLLVVNINEKKSKLEEEVINLDSKLKDATGENANLHSHFRRLEISNSQLIAKIDEISLNFQAVTSQSDDLISKNMELKMQHHQLRSDANSNEKNNLIIKA